MSWSSLVDPATKKFYPSLVQSVVWDSNTIPI